MSLTEQVRELRHELASFISFLRDKWGIYFESIGFQGVSQGQYEGTETLVPATPPEEWSGPCPCGPPRITYGTQDRLRAKMEVRRPPCLRAMLHRGGTQAMMRRLEWMHKWTLLSRRICRR